MKNLEKILTMAKKEGLTFNIVPETMPDRHGKPKDYHIYEAQIAGQHVRVPIELKSVQDSAKDYYAFHSLNIHHGTSSQTDESCKQLVKSLVGEAILMAGYQNLLAKKLIYKWQDWDNGSFSDNQFTVTFKLDIPEEAIPVFKGDGYRQVGDNALYHITGEQSNGEPRLKAYFRVVDCEKLRNIYVTLPLTATQEDIQTTVKEAYQDHLKKREETKENRSAVLKYLAQEDIPIEETRQGELKAESLGLTIYFNDYYASPSFVSEKGRGENLPISFRIEGSTTASHLLHFAKVLPGLTAEEAKKRLAL